MLFQRFRPFGSDKSKRLQKHRRKQKRQFGSLRIEALEVRQMLSITPGTPDTITATEGISTGNTLVANFTISAPQLNTDTYSASINWGDSSASAGTVTFSGANGTVTGTHTYAEETPVGSPHSLSITVTDTTNPTSATISGAANVDDAPLTAGAVSATVGTEGVVASTLTAAFTDANSVAPTSDFSGTIDWGDGTLSPFTSAQVSGSGGHYTITDSHLYAEEGVKPLSVVIKDIGGASPVTDTGSANVSDATLTAGTATITAGTEGVVANTLTATFSDANTGAPTSDFSGTIHWGDGTSSSFTSAQVSGSGGNYTVTTSHLYAEDGIYGGFIVVNDEGGASLVAAIGNANVAEADMSVFPGAVGATEGHTFTGAVAAILDPGSIDPAADYTATIDWGDGTVTSGTVTGSNGFYPISGSHVYQDEGKVSLTVTAVETTAAPPFTTSATFSQIVADGDVLNPIAATLSATEGTTYSGAVATFINTGYPTNPGSDFKAMINWGDGSMSAATSVTNTAGTLTVFGSHLYGDEKSYSLSVVLSDDAPGTATALATGTATVAEGDVLAPATATLTATEGTTFSGTVATFTNTGYPNNVASDFTATITWGDGNPDTVGTVTGGSGAPLTVSGSHLYADESTGLPLTVTLHDNAPGTASATATGTATILEGDTLVPVGTVAVDATEGTAFNGTVAIFSNVSYPGNPATDFTATITWGDGTTAAGTISGSNGVFTVSGSHLYVDELVGAPVSVVINDDAPGTASATANGTVTVQDADVLAPVSATVNAVERANFSGTVATFSNTGYPANVASDFTATIDWGDGTTTIGTVSGSAGTLTVSGSHLYVEENNYPLKVVLTDDAPGTASATATGTATVALPPGVGFLAGVPGDSTPQTFVHNLYRELLGREPDSGGFTAAVSYLEAHDNILGRATLIQSFMNSAEYKAHYITTVYQLFLERAPDASGLAYWTNKMGDPGTPSLSRGSGDELYIVAAILGSDEFYFKAGNTPQGWINALYHDLLGRPAEAGALTFWENKLAANPTDRDGLVRDILSSPEAVHDLLDSFYSVPGGTASTPLATPGTTAGFPINDLAMLTGAGWENLYLEGPVDSGPFNDDPFLAALASEIQDLGAFPSSAYGSDPFLVALAKGAGWDNVQLAILASDQFYTNPNQPITKDLS